MKILINNDKTKNKNLEYDENFWTGKKKITYDGIVLNKLNKNTYEYNDGTTVHYFELKGNYLFGITIKMFENIVQIREKLSYLEIILSVLVLLPGIFFGAIGGALGGACFVLNIFLISQQKNIWFKILISVFLIIICLSLSYIMAYLVFKTIF